MRADGIAIQLPPNPAPYVTEWLMEIGPVGSGGAGPVPLSWGDIADWQKLALVELTPWEARTIHQLSRTFLNQMHEARKPTCPPPYSAAADNGSAVDRQFRKLFQVMKNIEADSIRRGRTTDAGRNPRNRTAGQRGAAAAGHGAGQAIGRQHDRRRGPQGQGGE